METFNVMKKSLVITFASIILACGAETLAAIVFIPAFTATWPDANDIEHRVNIQSDDEGKESGIIFGDEQHDSDSDKRGDLSGSFNGLNIEFTVERPTGDIKFIGKMIPVSNEDHNITRIELNSSEGKLILSAE
ncbi:hypothetical protein [Algibacter sp. 2305UL17-15]|uniref:hypothetical protein n=1 Tax=Algibacter sp. 2305UL17-15 TaxID=3231268 RepID=UPI003459C3A2